MYSGRDAASTPGGRCGGYGTLHMEDSIGVSIPKGKTGVETSARCLYEIKQCTMEKMDNPKAEAWGVLHPPQAEHTALKLVTLVLLQ